jgi:hypothetical protein
MQLQQFGLIDDQDHFTLGARAEDANAQTYGCGCWWFKK